MLGKILMISQVNQITKEPLIRVGIILPKDKKTFVNNHQYSSNPSNYTINSEPYLKS